MLLIVEECEYIIRKGYEMNKEMENNIIELKGIRKCFDGESVVDFGKVAQ